MLSNLHLKELKGRNKLTSKKQPTVDVRLLLSKRDSRLAIGTGDSGA